MPSILLEDKEIGPFYLGDQLPDLTINLVWDTGGPVDLSLFPTASFTVKRLHGTSVVLQGDTLSAITYNSLPDGQLTIAWPSAFTAVGTYRLRLVLAAAGGKKQTVQRAVFRVIEDE